MARSTLPRWRALLQQVGYHAVEHGELSPTGRTRALTVLTASHSLLHTMLVDGVPWPERVLATHMGDGTEVLNVHSPISPKSDLAKVRTHEAVRRHLVDVHVPAQNCVDNLRNRLCSRTSKRSFSLYFKKGF